MPMTFTPVWMAQCQWNKHPFAPFTNCKANGSWDSFFSSVVFSPVIPPLLIKKCVFFGSKTIFHPFSAIFSNWTTSLKSLVWMYTFGKCVFVHHHDFTVTFTFNVNEQSGGGKNWKVNRRKINHQRCCSLIAKRIIRYDYNCKQIKLQLQTLQVVCFSKWKTLKWGKYAAPNISMNILSRKKTEIPHTLTSLLESCFTPKIAVIRLTEN